jgi:hypothetical protein
MKIFNSPLRCRGDVFIRPPHELYRERIYGRPLGSGQGIRQPPYGGMRNWRVLGRGGAIEQSSLLDGIARRLMAEPTSQSEGQDQQPWPLALFEQCCIRCLHGESPQDDYCTFIQ